MQRIVTINLLIAFLIFGFIHSGMAGEIVGFITDSETGDPLPGANVFIEGTSLGAATDLEGFFRIKALDPGEYKIIINYIGYATHEGTLTVVDEARTEYNTELKLETLEGETIVVTGNLEGQLAAINQQLSANTIVNVVSKERIRELPDDNAAESVARRLHGKSFKGKRVAVRLYIDRKEKKDMAPQDERRRPDLKVAKRRDVEIEGLDQYSRSFLRR